MFTRDSHLGCYSGTAGNGKKIANTDQISSSKVSSVGVACATFRESEAKFGEYRPLGRISSKLINCNNVDGSGEEPLD